MSSACAVVVTYNRPELLLENIEALVAQTFKLKTIVVVDNYSTKDTLVKLYDKGYLSAYSDEIIKNGGKINTVLYNANGEPIEFILLRLNKNVGGSGGFNKGMRYFYENTVDDLVWIMDDDTIPHDNSLLELMKGYNYLVENKYNPGFMCSRVLEINSTHGNSPVFTSGNDIFKYFSLDNQFISVEACSFVSALFTRASMRKCGLPIKEFFIWHDDLEYTGRMSKMFDNIICLASTVLHKRELNAAIEQITDNNCFKYINGFRNEAFLNMEMHNPIRRSLRLMISHFKKIHNSRISFRNKYKLLVSSLYGVFLFRPKREYFE